MSADKYCRKLTNIFFFLLFGALSLSKFFISAAILGLILMGVIHVARKGVSNQPRFINTYAPLVLVYIIFSTSLLYSDNIKLGLQELLIQNGILSVPVILFVHFRLFKEQVIHYLNIFLVTTAIACIITVVFFILPVQFCQQVVETFSILQDYPNVINKTQFGLYSPFIDRLHFAYIISFAFLYCIYSYLKKGTKENAYYAILFFVTIILLGARGAQLALLIGLTPFMVVYLHEKYFPADKYWKFKTYSVAFAFLITLPFILYQSIPAVHKRYDQLRWEIELIKNDQYRNFDYQHFTTLTRLMSFQNSWEVVKENPIFGVGVGDVQSKLEEKFKINSPDVPLHNQNYYLYLWMVGGIAALSMFLFFMTFWLKRMLNHNESLTKALASSYWIFVLLILLIDLVMKYHIGVFTIPLFLGCISTLKEKEM